jgi:raffinose/stachyose/melibiose transport system permease protein
MRAADRIIVNKKPIRRNTVLIYLFLVLLAVIYIVPLLWVVSVSVKTNSEVFSSPFGLPKVFQWGNYAVAWTAGKLGIATLNSMICCIVTLAVSMILGAMVAFGISRMKWKLSGIVLVYFMLGMMVPIHCVLIPLFTSFAKVGLTESTTGLILPYITFALPIVIFVLAGFFRSMPGEMFEAACIDGCSIYGCFFRIALPLAKTGFAVTCLMTFVNTWNELLVSMVFISDPAKKTLPVQLSSFVGPYATNYTQMFAAIVIAVLPSIVIYSIFSNQIVEGLTTGAVKG